MTRDELIAALEAAGGPSWELDAEIYAGVVRRDLADTRTAGHGVSGNNQFYEAGGDGKGWHSAPEYTASLDAALSLVPDDMNWGIGGGTFAGTAGVNGGCVETAATPAIALCLAAIRARGTGEG